MTDKKQSLEEWWEEDANRLNDMTKTAHDLKVVVKVGQKKAPLAKIFKKLRKKKNGSK